LGYYVDSSRVIPNGIDTSLFAPSNEVRSTVRSWLGVPSNAFLIGLIARYHPQKDHATFLQAAALLIKRHPEVHFLLAGLEVDWENQTLQHLVQELKLLNQIHMLGECSDILSLTAALDIAVSSSSYGEGLSLAIGEAMACEVPCVVTDVGDSAILVSNTGIVVPPRNPPALANAWECLIDAGAEARCELGKAARERILQHYSLESIVRNYENLYLSLRRA
jgi:glycosyltransferase involved in cell wall biosynthesis